MAHIFLSYKRTDQDRVAPIVTLLKARGWSVWWDTRINAGEQWDEVIEREINAARCVVAIWSCQSVNSRWVRTEASEGLERGILVPVLIDATKPPLEFKRIQCIDLKGWKGDAEEPSAKALIGAVARFLGRPSVDAAHGPAERQRHSRETSLRQQKHWALIERARCWMRLAAFLAGRYGLAAKAWAERLALRVKAGRPALREKLLEGSARAILPALVVALIAVAGSALWLAGWPDEPQSTPKVTEAERTDVEVVLNLARRRIADDDILGARRTLKDFEGFAPGRITLALGEAYDPNMLAAWGSRGVAADAEQAKSFYRKAQGLGVPGAKKRLENLNLPELPVAKKEASGLRIGVAPSINVVRPAWQAALPIRVSPLEALPKNAFVRLRGLPARVALSEGQAIASGLWAVPMFALASLEAIVPAAVAGRSTIVIRLVGADGTTLAEARTELVVVETVDKDSGAPPRGEPRSSPMLLSGGQRKRAEKLVAKGWEYWDTRNVAAARLFFEPAAELGLADAAIGMAKTFDPEELDRIGAVGPAPDPGRAIKWYEIASKMGARDAEGPLKRLKGRLAP